MRKLKFQAKYIPACLLIAACLVVGVLCAVKAVDEIKYNETLAESSLIDFSQITITADGGNGTDIPKNTTYAVDDLVTKQFSSMKIDARLTKDKKWVSLKNGEISEITNGKGNVKSYNYYDLLNFNLKNFMPREFPVIELVTTTAKYAYENSISPIIYLHDYNKSAIKNLLKTLEADGTNVSRFASSDIRTLQYIGKLKNDVTLIFYVDEITEEAIDICKDDYRFSLCFNAENKNNSNSQIENLILNEVPFLCYGVENLKDIEELYKIGVRHFVTDTVKVG